MFAFNYTVPELKRSKSYDFDVNVTYTTEYGQTLLEEFEGQIILGNVPNLDIETNINKITIE